MPESPGSGSQGRQRQLGVGVVEDLLAELDLSRRQRVGVGAWMKNEEALAPGSGKKQGMEWTMQVGSSTSFTVTKDRPNSHAHPVPSMSNFVCSTAPQLTTRPIRARGL